MTHQLIKYESACMALAECKAVDEVKAWADKAAAMQAYGRMAKDRTLEIDASEIRIRAERRLGELIAAQKAGDGLNAGVRMAGKSADASALVIDEGRSVPKLADAGISYDLSSRAQKLAAVPADEFEAELAAKRERDQQDGARVSARLQKRGAAVMQEAAEHETYGPSAEEIAEAEASARDDAERVRLILDADDVVAALTEKCKQQAAQIRILESRIAGLTNANAEHIRTIKRLQRQAERAAA